MGLMSRNKGKAGEREAAALIRDLTGWDVRRRVRQHDGDSDLLGVPGWAVEIKRYASAGRSDIAGWWDQTVAQAGDLVPVLFYRLDRGEWTAVWPLCVILTMQTKDMWRDFRWTCHTSIDAWAATASEVALMNATINCRK